MKKQLSLPAILAVAAACVVLAGVFVFASWHSSQSVTLPPKKVDPLAKLNALRAKIGQPGPAATSGTAASGQQTGN